MLLFFLHLLQRSLLHLHLQLHLSYMPSGIEASVGFSDDMLCLHACVLFYRENMRTEYVRTLTGTVCVQLNRRTHWRIWILLSYTISFSLNFPFSCSPATFVICAFAWIGLAMDGGWNECYTYGVPVISFTFPSIFTIQMDSNQKARLLHNFRHWAKTHWRWLWHLFFPCTYVRTYTCIFSSICSVYFVTRLSLFS